MQIEDVASECGRHAESSLVYYAPDGAVERTSLAKISERALALAERLAAAGLQAGHVIGIQAENHPDWLVWDLATARLNAVLRPYPSHHEFIPAERVAAHGLALLVSDRPAHMGQTHVAPLGPEDFSGPLLRLDAPRSQQSDLHSLVYSSGTTGREKVLMINRRGAEVALNTFIDRFNPGPDDRHVVFLPLANYQQRQQAYLSLYSGVNLVLCGWPQALRAIRQEKATFLLAPPALYENVLSIAEEGGLPLPALFGGEVRFLITGMAPIRPRAIKAYWDAGLKLLEGYGLTEAGIIACNTVDRYRLGTVGPVLDADAFSLSEEGEVLIRQRHPLSLGYLDADDLNASTFEADGTIRTGDQGRLDEDGFLILEGRLKDMIALPSGKKLNPADIEQILLQLPGVEDAVAVDNGGVSRQC